MNLNGHPLCETKIQIYNISMRNRKRMLFGLLLVGLMVLGCGGRAETPTATLAIQPTATLPVTVPTANEELSAIGPSSTGAVHWIDAELLANDALASNCDGSDDIDFVCTALTNTADTSLTVDITGGAYARWSLRADAVAGPLTGDETLVLHARRTGNITPNLYLVERSGRRVPVSLARFGLVEGEQTVAIPLREIRDEERQWPEFSEVTEIQIVFEWAEMAGELTLHSLQFVSAWETEVPVSVESQSLAAALVVHTGFTVQAIADRLREGTQLEIAADGTLWASTQGGRIWRYRDTDNDGRYDRRLLYASGFEEVVGLLYDPVDGALWVGGRGQLYRTVDNDGNGVADQRELRLDGLPWGRHQNNGLAWNPAPDPFTGEPGNHWIYIGLGSTEDLEVGGPWNAQVVRFPRDGQGEADLQTVSRGNRNPYMVIWAPVPVDVTDPDGTTTWQLFASENGPDFNDAPDEVNHIRWQHDYGFPAQYGPVDSAAGAIEGEPYSSPLYPVVAHASASGLAYVTNPTWPISYQTLYVSLFGQVFSEGIVGHTVDRIALIPMETATGLTYRGIPSVFVAGLDRPLAMTTAPNGDLVVGDYATGVVYQISYQGSP